MKQYFSVEHRHAERIMLFLKKDGAGKGGKNPSPGGVLSDADMLHYRRITVPLRETISLMAEIDKVIEQHGGLLDAFASTSPKADDIPTDRRLMDGGSQ